MPSDCDWLHWNNEILRCKSNKAYLESICWELQDTDERSQRWVEWMERHVMFMSWKIQHSNSSQNEIHTKILERFFCVWRHNYSKVYMEKSNLVKTVLKE